MNEDEKRAIEKIKETIECFYCFPNPTCIELKDCDCSTLEIALKLIEKLQKENEELKIKNNAIKRESEAYAELMIRLDNELNLEKEKSKYEWIRQNCLPQELVNKLYIPVQKVKDKMEKDIKTNEHTILGRRNGKTLEYGRRLGRIEMCKELLESEE